MTHPYYSSRTNHKSITTGELYTKLQNIDHIFCNKDFFKGKAKITKDYLPDTIKHEAALAFTFQPFPVTEWDESDITDDHIFDTIEFLYDYVSKPGKLVGMTADSGEYYEDYGSYDDEAGQEEFRNKANTFLVNCKTGFEITKDGIILALGTDGLQHILNEEIIPYDEANVDSKVRNAIAKWRNRHLSLSEKKEAIRELADVFEWLKDTQRLGSVLCKNDDSVIFNIANKFGIRHHDQRQKTNYDQAIWYPWMFHFYLATYRAVIQMLKQKDN